MKYCFSKRNFTMTFSNRNIAKGTAESINYGENNYSRRFSTELRLAIKTGFVN